MSEKQWNVWDMMIETITAAAILVFVGLQIYYRFVYQTSWGRFLYHLFPVIAIYAGMLVLEIFPEMLNIGNKERLKGMVRVYAIRMVRNCKLLFVLGMLFPSVADTLGIGMDGAYSLLIMGGMIGIIGYYMYRIYQYNVSQNDRNDR